MNKQNNYNNCSMKHTRTQCTERDIWYVKQDTELVCNATVPETVDEFWECHRLLQTTLPVQLYEITATLVFLLTLVSTFFTHSHIIPSPHSHIIFFPHSHTNHLLIQITENTPPEQLPSTHRQRRPAKASPSPRETVFTFSLSTTRNGGMQSTTRQGRRGLCRATMSLRAFRAIGKREGKMMILRDIGSSCED